MFDGSAVQQNGSILNVVANNCPYDATHLSATEFHWDSITASISFASNLDFPRVV
jgi:hypothetical protein